MALHLGLLVIKLNFDPSFIGAAAYSDSRDT
jgi:hypothetical protein